MSIRKAALMLITLFPLLGGTGVAEAVDFGARLSGGTAAAWERPYEAGNLVGATLTLDVGDLQGGLSAGLVLPDSRADGQFNAFGLEGQWHPFRRSDWASRLHLSPYLVAGIGLVDADAPPADPVVPVVRWVTQGPQFLGQLGVGLAFGAPNGLYLSLDFRAYNHTHGGLVISAGFRI